MVGVNIVVFGKNGQLAKSLRNQANLDANYIPSSKVNFLRPDDVTDFLNSTNPDLIINTSAYTNVVAAENDKKSAYKINVESVERISNFANQKKIHLIHISTELVFDGKKKLPYLESDVTNPLNIYGKTKMLGENKVMENCINFAILRTSWLYSHYGENFLMKIFNAASSGKKIFGVTDRFANPTSAFELARIISMVVEKIREGGNIKGIFHYSGSEPTSRYSFIKLICEVMKDRNIISEYEIAESVSNSISDGVKRPEIATFSNEKIKTLFALKDKSLKHCIEEVIDYM